MSILMHDSLTCTSLLHLSYALSLVCILALYLTYVFLLCDVHYVHTVCSIYNEHGVSIHTQLTHALSHSPSHTSSTISVSHLVVSIFVPLSLCCQSRTFVKMILRVWDILFAEGPKILFRVAVSLICTRQTALCKMEMSDLLTTLLKLHQVCSRYYCVS